ncbi:uncharacterized protein BDW43DRAFT_310940 [Aspergillus alliaceus]|uniref:uncharacterized protein n=1 Tax=Petromyces alliaceus TaxID=209559 RepID=UPI0012A6DC66|nr:uncharacterized protein BDW43DRAFT_310940 [Aspergillus alliaceus]KAB8233583.1 hypothetical protein BDW43DRAFT_310940 [Aspergillus alliaceus]
MPPPQKGKLKSRGSDEEFVLFLQGIPAHCRWQELKDLVRQTALHIRQAVVYDDHHGFPTGLGQIIVKNEDEAWRTYRALSTNGWEGQSLVVTLARTSSPTRPIAGPTKSPSVIPSNYAPGYSTPPRVSQNMAVPPSPISPEPMIAGPSPTYPPPEYGHAPVISLPHQSFIPIYPDPLSQPMPGIPPSPALRPSFCDSLTFTVYPPYPISPIPSFQDPSTHHPNNRRTPHKPTYSYTYSYTPTPMPFYAPYPHPHPSDSSSSSNNNNNPRPHRRTIFIQNLSPTTTKSDLQSHLQDAGTIESCETSLDPTTNRCKGFARITFRTADEARRAVIRYNNSIFMNTKIRVKIDRSVPIAASYVSNPPQTASVAIPVPTIVSTQVPTPDAGHDAPTAGSVKCVPDEVVGEVKGDRCQPGPLVINGSGIGRKEIVI